MRCGVKDSPTLLWIFPPFRCILPLFFAIICAFWWSFWQNAYAKGNLISSSGTIPHSEISYRSLTIEKGKEEECNTQYKASDATVGRRHTAGGSADPLQSCRAACRISLSCFRFLMVNDCPEILLRRMMRGDEIRCFFTGIIKRQNFYRVSTGGSYKFSPPNYY